MTAGEAVLLVSLMTLALVVATAVRWRWRDSRGDQGLVDQLLAFQPTMPNRFDPSMVAHLPDPARRYFHFTIETGTPLYTVAEIEMTGRLGLGSKTAPGYKPMRATQVLAAPFGFIWQVRTGGRFGQISGTDAAGPKDSWSRFWLLGLIPVGRGGHTEDHARSSFGRLVAEAAFWAPAALLPSATTRWEAGDNGAARVVVTFNGMEQALDIAVAEDGQPLSVRLLRWSNANPEKTFRLQPFGGTLSDFKVFSGYRLPTRVDGGNFFGTDDYFPFFQAEISDVRFPARPGNGCPDGGLPAASG